MPYAREYFAPKLDAIPEAMLLKLLTYLVSCLTRKSYYDTACYTIHVFAIGVMNIDGGMSDDPSAANTWLLLVIICTAAGKHQGLL